MNQININTVPSITVGIPKKTAEISWASDVVTRDKKAESKNFKKKK